MEQNKKVFIDSNFFIAFFNTADALHDKAIKIGEVLERERIILVISNFIFLEVVTVLSQRVNKFTAMKVGKYFLESPEIELIHVDETLQNQSWIIFSAAEEKNISFVDCSTIATMKAESLSKLLTFDKKDFQKLQKRHRFQFFQ